MTREAEGEAWEQLADHEEHLRRELLIAAIELADRFDDEDHRTSPTGMGTDVQDDCQSLREWARGRPRAGEGNPD